MKPMPWEPGAVAAGVDMDVDADAEADADADMDAEAPAPKPARKSDVLILLRLRDQIKQQLAEYSTAVDAREVICCDYIKNQNKIKKDIEDWEKRMEEVTISLQNKTLALQRIQLTFALRNKMKQNDDDDSRLIMETVKRIVALSQRIIKYQQRARENEQKLSDIRRKRLTLKTAGREKLLKVQTMMKKQKEEQASVNMVETREVIHNELEKEIQMTTVIKNVFQSIILASRVNWAEDPSLKAIVLQLEDDVHLL